MFQEERVRSRGSSREERIGSFSEVVSGRSWAPRICLSRQRLMHIFSCVIPLRSVSAPGTHARSLQGGIVPPSAADFSLSFRK